MKLPRCPLLNERPRSEFGKQARNDLAAVEKFLRQPPSLPRLVFVIFDDFLAGIGSLTGGAEREEAFSLRKKIANARIFKNQRFTGSGVTD